MLTIAGITYVLDFEALDNILTLEESLKTKEVEETEIKEVYDADNNFVGKEVLTKNFLKGKEIDATRYEMIRFLIEMIFGNNEEFDDTLGLDRALSNTSIGFKISFNTLLDMGIIKEID
jgi:hypothetical protein